MVTFLDYLSPAGLCDLAAYWRVNGQNAGSLRAKLETLFSDPKLCHEWLARLSPDSRWLVNSLALKGDTMALADLDARVAARVPDPAGREAIRREWSEHRILYRDDRDASGEVFLHPDLRAACIDEIFALAPVALPEPPVLNPTFHPLGPFRRFLAAISGEGYRALGDESFFSKPSERKIRQKYVQLPSDAALQFLFRFSLHMDFVVVRDNRAVVNWPVLYEFNFHQVAFLYFAYLLLTQPPALPLLLHRLSPGFGVAALPFARALLACPQIEIHARTPPTPYRAFSHFPLHLSADDLVDLGFLLRQGEGESALVWWNPWYAEWLWKGVPALGRERPSDFGQRFMVGANYEILVPPDLAWPSFLQLIALAKSTCVDLVSHLFLSKASVGAGIRAGVDPHAIVPFFERYAWSIPDTVRAALKSWTDAAGAGEAVAESLHPHGHMRIEELRRELNRRLEGEPLALLSALPSGLKRRGGSMVPFSFFAETRVGESKSMASEGAKAAPAPVADRRHLFALEDHIRRKAPCLIVHVPREGKRKERTILPLRIHRDGVSVFVEAKCLDLDIVRSFKLSQILEVREDE